jgi:hypothetical protein
MSEHCLGLRLSSSSTRRNSASEWIGSCKLFGNSHVVPLVFSLLGRAMANRVADVTPSPRSAAIAVSVP